MKAAISNLSKQNPLMLAAGAALLVWAVYLLARKVVGDAAGAAGGLFSGKNAITKGTAYEGAGAAGTLGAAVDAVTGGATSSLGEWIGGLLASDKPGESVYYIATFPDGQKHAIASTTVASDGSFAYKGARYVLGMQGATRVAKVAA